MGKNENLEKRYSKLSYYKELEKKLLFRKEQIESYRKNQLVSLSLDSIFRLVIMEEDIQNNSFQFSNSDFQIFSYSSAKNIIRVSNFVYKSKPDFIFIEYNPELTFRKLMNIYNIENVYEQRVIYTQLRVANRNFIYPYIDYENQLEELKDLKLDEPIPECIIIRLPNIAALNLHIIDEPSYPFEDDGEIITDLSTLYKN
jgi:hypothetical protein